MDAAFAPWGSPRPPFLPIPVPSPATVAEVPVGHGRAPAPVEPCAASSRTAVECQARLSPAAWPSSLQTLPAAHTQQWRLDPGRPRLPEPKAAAGTETWLRSQSTACTCFSSLCGLGQMWTRTPCEASWSTTAVLEARKLQMNASPEGPRAKCVSIHVSM
jgi:hypothetical protein